MGDNMTPEEYKADALRKQCCNLCAGCRHGQPYDEATGMHTLRKPCHTRDMAAIEKIIGRPLTKDEFAANCVHCAANMSFDPADAKVHMTVSPCAARELRAELKATGCHTITEAA